MTGGTGDFYALLCESHAMEDTFLTACAKALPESVLELIFKMYVQKSILEHPYITEEARTAHVVSIREPYNVGDMVILPRRYVFSNNGMLDMYYHPKMATVIDTLIVHTVMLSLDTSADTPLVKVYLEEKPLTQECIRKALATVIVLLHKMVPNKIQKNTPIKIYDFRCKTHMRMRSFMTTLHHIFHCPMDKWDLTIQSSQPRKRSSFCAIM